VSSSSLSDKNSRKCNWNFQRGSHLSESVANISPAAAGRLCSAYMHEMPLVAHLEHTSPPLHLSFRRLHSLLSYISQVSLIFIRSRHWINIPSYLSILSSFPPFQLGTVGIACVSLVAVRRSQRWTLHFAAPSIRMGMREGSGDANSASITRRTFQCC
jgi:hypothetical protein